MRNIPLDISPFAFLTMTNGIGALLLGAAFFKRPRKGICKRDLLCSVILSVMNVAYNSLTIIAMRFMDSAAGSVYISFTLALNPIMLLIMGRKVTKSILIGMTVISLGIVLASLDGIWGMNVKGPAIMLAVCVIRDFYLIKMNVKQKMLLVAVLSAVFVFVAVPFKVMSLIPGFTEIRPVNCFNMLYGLLFGIYGALACAFGNLIADILGGTFAISSWAGFAANFLGAYLAHVIWYRTVKKRPLIRNVKEAAVFTALAVLTAVMIAAIIAFGVGISYPEIDLVALVTSIIINNIVFAVLLGLPLLITAENTYNVIGTIPGNIKRDEEI